MLERVPGPWTVVLSPSSDLNKAKEKFVSAPQTMRVSLVSTHSDILDGPV